jgi:hypothetical protein
VITGGIVLQAMMWTHFVRRLGSFMSGSRTVDANCWKFLPLRRRFLVEQSKFVRGYDIVR